jgi:CubicO group peptidase (beta-lactamase class C family)
MIQKLNQMTIDNQLNIYSIAVLDDKGLQTRRLRPADACTNCYSVAKFYTMTAIGMLWDQGKLRVEDRVVDIFREEFPQNADPNWQAVTVEHVIKHSIGFDRGFLDIDVEQISEYPTDDFLQLVFAEPLPHTPGSHSVYSDAAYYLLSRIVTKISGKPLDEFLRPVLFDIMGFQEAAWSKCPRGYCMGATGLYVRTADMVKLGYVYANNGQYEGKEVVSAQWVKLAVERKYSVNRLEGTDIYTKGGMFGQMLAFSPERHFACGWQGYETRKRTGFLLEKI